MAEDDKVLNVAVVSAERSLWSGQAKSIVAKTPEGDIGILPSHEPVLALLVESAPLRVEELDGSKLIVAIHGGFFSVAGNEVNVIAEVAEMGEDIDLERAKAALARAQDGGVTDEEMPAVRRAETRIQVAEIAKGITAR
ncbi:MAG: F0F1 ATP synthase subunit epsilon [Actinobacteria bacterium]|mgnify:CR=1 FL=1|nr:F0F1 ATP synthase subunit epsilon [Actinomycetota bacterium]